MNIKNYVFIKLPVKIENKEKASNMLGDTNFLYKVVKNGENLDFNFFYNKLILENCFSNDLLIQKKTLRNKKDKAKTKTVYKVLGKITNNIQSFSLEDFIYVNEEKTSIDDLKNYLIPKEMYDEEIKDKQLDNMNKVEEYHIIEKLVTKKKNELEGNNQKSIDIENYFSYIQPEKFSSLRMSSQKVPTTMNEKIKFEELNNL